MRIVSKACDLSLKEGRESGKKEKGRWREGGREGKGGGRRILQIKNNPKKRKEMHKSYQHQVSRDEWFRLSRSM